MIGLLDFFARFWRNRSPEPTKLRNALFGAALTKNTAELERLSAVYFHEITANFAVWQTVPQELRDSQVAIQNWASCLLAVAETLEKQGHPEAIRMLTGEPADSDEIEWLAGGISEAEAHRAVGRFQEELSILTGLVERLSSARGPLMARARAKLFAAIATAHLELGELDEARKWTQRALDECIACDDAEGVAVYRKNLEFLDAKRDAANEDWEFRRDLITAQRLSDAGDFAGSNDSLCRLLARATEGSDRARHLGKIWGLMGLNLYRLNDFPGARDFTARALEACRASGDVDGIRIYNFNLSFLDSKSSRA